MQARVIVSDPPWAFDDKLPSGEGKTRRGAAQQYPVLDLGEILRLRVEDVAADDAILALWCPAAMLHAGLMTMQAWGFDYKQTWIWVKRKKGHQPCHVDGLAFGMGRYARSCKEMVLVGTRGSVIRHLKTRSERDVIIAPATPHSEKPEELQDQLDRMFPDGGRVELFARRDRDGTPPWLCVGNECPTTMGEDIRDSLARLAPQHGLFGAGSTT